MEKLTIDELAALRGWDGGEIAIRAWSGEVAAFGPKVTRGGATFVPKALMRLDPNDDGFPEDVDRLYDFRHELLCRMANAEDEYHPDEVDDFRRDCFDRIRNASLAAIADGEGECGYSGGILMVLEILRDRILAKEPAHAEPA